MRAEDNSVFKALSVGWRKGLTFRRFLGVPGEDSQRRITLNARVLAKGRIKRIDKGSVSGLFVIMLLARLGRPQIDHGVAVAVD